MSIEYGYILQVQFKSKEDTLFFVERVSEEGLMLITREGDKVWLPLDDPEILEVTVVYIPPKTDYASIQHLYEGNWVKVIFPEETLYGKLIRTGPILEIESEGEIYYIPVRDGLPSDILRIEAAVAPQAKRVKVEIPEEILDELEEEEEEEYGQLFYTMDQKKSELTEALLQNVVKQSQSILKRTFLQVHRFQELFEKYTQFERGVLLKKLPENLYVDSFVKNTNPFFVPYTTHVMVKNRNVSESPMAGYYFSYREPDEVYDMYHWESSKNVIKQMPYLDFIYKEAKVVQCYDIKKNHTEKEQFPTSDKEVYLKEFAKYRVNEPFVTESFVLQPYSKLVSGSTILEKANAARSLYFDMYFRRAYDDIRTVHVTNEYKHTCERVDKLTFYKNECDTFEQYVNKVVPSFEDFMDCYLHTDFVNMAQALHELEYLKVDELNMSLYNEIVERMKKNIDLYILNRDKEKKQSLRQKQETRNIDTTELHKILQKDYSLGQRIKNAETSDAVYTTSELWKEGMFDHFHFYIVQYLKKNVVSTISDEEMAKLVDEIKRSFGEESPEKIHKVYEKEQQRENDHYKWILQDIPKGTQMITAEEELYRQLIQQRSSLTQDDIKIKLSRVRELGESQIGEQFGPELEPFVHEFLIQHKIMKGQVCLVQETQKKYRWTGEKWGDYDDVNTKKLVKIKDFKYNEETFSKKVQEMIHEFESEKLRQQALIKMKLEGESHKKSLDLAKRMWLKETMKYHTEKYHYYELELQKELFEPTPSPYLSLRNRILQEVSLENKYKAIQLFVEQYTKMGEDVHWYYCVVSGQRLLPVFYMELADAFLKTDQYPAALQRVCDRQGELSDNNDYYVDKYSGFPIKQIQFDDEEDYNDNGFRDVFHSVLEKEEKEEDNRSPVLNALKAFLKWMGVTPEEEALQNLLVLIEKSFMMAGGDKKKPREQQQIYIYSILTHSLIYAQTLEGKVSLTKPFPDCPKSLAGYPLNNTSKKGFEFVCCIVLKIPKNNEPWKSMAQIKLDKMMETAEMFMEKFVLSIQEVRDKLSNKRVVQDAPEQFPVWTHFYPRLGPIVPVQEVSENPQDRLMALSFRLQQKIHAHVSGQLLILVNQANEPYLINTCCHGNNNVFDYMTEHAKIAPVLKDIIDTLKIYRKKKEIRYTNHMYGPMDTKMPVTKISSSFDETIMYRGLIHMFFEGPIPEKLKKYKIVKPPEYKKSDPFPKRLEVVKQIPLSGAVFGSMLRDHAKVFERRKGRVIEEERTGVHPLDALLKKKDSDVYDYCMTAIEEKMVNILESGRDREERGDLQKCIQFYKVFRNQKNNDFLSPELEHKHSMSQILKNKIDSILYVFPQKIIHRKYPVVKLPRHWDLDDNHAKNILASVVNYDESLSDFYENDNWFAYQSKIEIEDYKRWLSAPLTIAKKYAVYAYIFVSLFEDYTKDLMDYVRVMMKIFLTEDRMALNFDKKQVDFLSDMAKKSETDIKTENLKKLTKEARRAQNAMKELKLGEWGVGLDKSLFQYDKNKYNEVWSEAKNIIEGMDAPDEIYGTYGVDDGENIEGFDGDEYYG